jgi:4-amino-4-deoxy-L-arabinose transferase-like glycosyltransferase
MLEGTYGSEPAAGRVWLARTFRSPSGDPAWVRPVLLVIVVLAGIAYAWQFNGARLEPFYGAAARSMSTSWHDFVFGAVDPAGTVTVDKLPGALWLQALSLRVFGFHVWAIVLPQVLEGMLTILVLYRAVRRLAGPVAGITAAVLLALSPITIELNRGNVADALLILLTVLAADATSRALLNGRLRSLLLAGVWVGLAFQTKMLQAWLIMPALAGAYLLAGAGSTSRRLAHLSLAGVVTVVVSLSWMSAVSLVPAHDRPYVDGTRNDSLFSQVFNYNGVARLGSFKLGALLKPAPFIEQEIRANESPNGNSESIPASWHRLLAGLFARDVGWLYPAAAISLICVLLAYRGAGRRAPERACVILWGLWLGLLFVFFSEGAFLNSYYVAALAPALAALCGTGVALAAKQWNKRRAHTAMAMAVISSAAYAIYILSGAPEAPAWLPATAAVAGGVGAILAIFSGIRPRRLGRRLMPLIVACALVVPAVASAVVVVERLGPFDAPFEPTPPPPMPASVYAQESGFLRELAASYPARYPLGAYASSLAAPWILASGLEILPIGGYFGGVPAPTLSELKRDVATDRVRVFLIPLAPYNDDPRILWILDHCHVFKAPSPNDPIRLALLDCP